MLAIVLLTLLFALGGWLLGAASRSLRVEGHPLADRIDAVLPQTQCAQCGYPGCRPYAEAIARGEADINLCPPGGEAGVRALADLLGREAKPLAADRPPAKPESVAVIDEHLCIGCALCIQACPVDAIIGAPRFMHTVIAAECTGCELCLPPCPVDCIRLEPPPEPVPFRPAPSRLAARP
jgi:electron transport complex protein RnfB